MFLLDNAPNQTPWSVIVSLVASGGLGGFLLTAFKFIRQIKQIRNEVEPVSDPTKMVAAGESVQYGATMRAIIDSIHSRLEQHSVDFQQLRQNTDDRLRNIEANVNFTRTEIADMRKDIKSAQV